MTRVLGFTTIIFLLSLSPANAANLCSCCAGQDAAESCSATCAATSPEEGQCLAAVDFAGAATIEPGINPLYDVSLRDLRLGDVNRGQAEAFRRLLETARRGAEADRRRALRSRARGEISTDEARRLAQRYDAAIVNYYLGIDAFRSSAQK